MLMRRLSERLLTASGDEAMTPFTCAPGCWMTWMMVVVAGMPPAPAIGWVCGC